MGAVEVIQVVVLAASIAASLYLSNKLSNKVDKALGAEGIADDTGPITNVNRGSYIPYVVGRARVGTLMAWVGARSFVNNLAIKALTKGSRGKRGHPGPSPNNEGTLERMWAPFCVGPVAEIAAIYISGRDGLSKVAPPITSFTSTTHPSGSGIILGIPTGIILPGGFNIRVFWGELDQPSDARLIDPVDGTGFISRWPGVAHMVIDGTLGRPPRWPLIDLDILVDIHDTGSVVLGSSTPKITTVTYPDGKQGLNGAHILAQLLFGSPPHGLALDSSLFDIPSLEALGGLLSSEGILSSVVGDGGEPFKALIGSLMQDLGVMISWDTLLGKYKFVSIRSPSNIPVIPSSMIIKSPVETQVRHQEGPVERGVFRFLDVARRFRPSTVDVGSDSAALGGKGIKIKTVQLKTVIDHDTAVKVSERRSQEALGNEGRYKMTLDRRASTLYPGRAFSLSGVAPRLLVLSSKLDVLSGQVKINAMEDSLGVGASSLVISTALELPPFIRPVKADDRKKILEEPLFTLAAGDPPAILVPRVRNNNQIARADIHLSDDNTTYNLVGSTNTIQAGGVLFAALPAGVPLLEVGPEVTLLGAIDDDIFEDLTAKTAEWRQGDQVVCIGEELMFVRKLVAVGNGRWRMEGILRARMGTVQASHASNDDAYIFSPGAVFRTSNAILLSANQIFIKTQPATFGQQTDLAAEVAVSRTLYMTGHRPLPPVNFRVRGGTNSYVGGTDVIFDWSYLSRGGGQLVQGNNGSGAGMANGGLAVSDAPPEGDAWLIRIYTDPLGANTLVNTFTVLPVANGLQSFTYVEGVLIADVGPGTDFAAELTERGNGLESSPVRRIIVEFN